MTKTTTLGKQFFVVGSIVACFAADLRADATPATQSAPSAATEPAEPAPLDLGMTGLEAIGLKPTFDALHLKFYGWVEQSATWNELSPHDHVNVGRVFDVRSNDYLLNQAVVNLERPLAEGKDFDMGGKIELLYGSDGRFIHSSGLLDNISGDRDNPFHGDSLNFDPVQFYLQARAPIGNGLIIKAGKFVTPFGLEVIDAPGNALFSHSFLFGYAIPFTHTGIHFDYPISDQLDVYYGFCVGWDDFTNRNKQFTHMAGLTWKATDKLTLYLNAITGAERTNNNHSLRTVVDSSAVYQMTDALSLSANVDYGNESGTAVAGAEGNNWYGAAGYVTYVILPKQLATTWRLEVFRDETGSRLGVPATGAGVTAAVTELTWGFDVHPIRKFQNLRLRPEIRWDHGFGGKPFDQGTSRNQVTIGGDLILTF